MKIISTTKIIFGNKVVRLIFFLLVIGGILTGVAFGIIALTRSLKNPCTTDPTRPIYDPDTKACVPDCGKKNMCNNPKKDLYQKCVPDNYCPGSYIYDKNSCECTITCGSGLEPFTQDGKSSTIKMKKDANGKYTPENPSNPLNCRIPCKKFRTDIDYDYDGGLGYCNTGYLCAESISDSTPPNQLDPGRCLPAPPYSMCENSDTACLSKAVCMSISGEERCHFQTCGYDNGGKSDSEKNFFACSVHEDCGNNGICTAKTSFKEVGYCKNTTESSESKRCVKKSQIGENNNGGIIICDPSLDGVSTTHQQCYNYLKTGTLYGPGNDLACTSSICENGWQGENDRGCITDGTMPGCTTTQCYAPDSKCCQYPASSPEDPTNSKLDYCCGRKTHLGYCTNNTKYPYSKLMLLGPSYMNTTPTFNQWIYLNDPIPTPNSTEDERLAYYLTALKKVLKLDPHTTVSQEEPSYVNVYFAVPPGTSYPAGTKVLYASGGMYQHPPSSHPVNWKASEFYITDNDTNGTNGNPVSYISTKNLCLGTSPVPYTDGGYSIDARGAFICKSVTKRSSDEKHWWTKLHVPGGAPDGTNFKTEVDIDNNSSCSKKEDLRNMCGAIAENIGGYNDVSIDETNNKCVFTADCDDMITTGIHDPSKSGRNVKWSQIGSYLETSSSFLEKNPRFKHSIAQTGRKTISGPECIGNSGSFPPLATINPSYTTGFSNQCAPWGSVKTHYLQNGQYCPNGVSLPGIAHRAECNP